MIVDAGRPMYDCDRRPPDLAELVVLNKEADSIWYADTDRGERLAAVETDFNPYEEALSPDGGTVYITCSLGNLLVYYLRDTPSLSGIT